MVTVLSSQRLTLGLVRINYGGGGEPVRMVCGLLG
jgi:hypothetical protein